MSKLVDRVLGFMGFEEEEVEIIEDDEMMIQEEDAASSRKKKNSPIFSLHTQKQTKVVVCVPKVFEDCQFIADHLKNRRPVIVNLEEADKELAKRVVDFVSGTTYALTGSMQKVGNGIFLFVPSNMDISGEVNKEQEKEKDKSLFTWIR